MDQWPCLTKGGSACNREELVYNIDLICDTGPAAQQRTALYHTKRLELAGNRFAVNCSSALSALCGPEQRYHDCPPCLLNNSEALSDAGCDAEQLSSYCGNKKYDTECPAPKAAIRRGEMKLLVECYDMSTSSFTGAYLVVLFHTRAIPRNTPSYVATLRAQESSNTHMTACCAGWLVGLLCEFSKTIAGRMYFARTMRLD